MKFGLLGEKTRNSLPNMYDVGNDRGILTPTCVPVAEKVIKLDLWS